MTTTNEDGSIVAGKYGFFSGNVIMGEESWIWTQNTGSISLPALLEDATIVNGNTWKSQRYVRNVMGMTSDGKTILFGGYYNGGTTGLTQYAAAIVRLLPKSPEKDPATR